MMKYTCYKQTVSKVAECKVDNVEDVKAILDVICSHGLTCSMQIKDTYGVLVHKKVRVKSIEESTFSYIVFSSLSTLCKKSEYTDILELSMVTNMDKIITVLQPQISRWSLIESEDLNESGELDE